MNAARRKEINEAHARLVALNDQLQTLKSEAEELVGTLETIRDAEQEYFDNMPESLQQGDKGQSAEQAIQYLEEAIDAVTTLQDLDDLDEAADSLDNATNA